MFSLNSLSKVVTVFIVCAFHQGRNIVRGEYKCPENWIVQGSNCFYLNSTRASTWHQAVQICDSKNATLAKITDEDQSKFVGQKLRGDAWIGVHDDIGDESYTWLDEGLPLNFTYWGIGEPNNAAENCVSMYGYTTNKGRWNDHFCRTYRRYICEKPADSSGCPDKWKVFAGRCYFFSNDSQTWFDARKNCQNTTSSDLVAIENTLENGFLKDSITRTNYWIGLNDINEEGVFKWNDQTNMPTFYLWNFGEPNNANNIPVDCVTMMSQHYRRHGWVTAYCKAFYAFICEKPKEENEDCGDGWTSSSPNDTSCYQYNRNMTDWANARKICQQNGGDLVVIDSYEEQNFLRTMFYSQSWIGLNDLKTAGQWSWLDESDPVWISNPATGSTGKYTNWYRNEPSTRMQSVDCVLAHAGAHNVGKWANVNCAMRAGYICESASASCTGIWKSFNNHCYSFNIDVTSWDEAIARCKLQVSNSNLVVIDTKAEQDFITENLKGISNSPGFWTGLNCKEVRQQFKWLNSTTPVSIQNWAPRYPSFYLQEACVNIHSSGYNRQGKWNDLNCMELRGYVCKLPAEGDSSYYDFSLNQSIYKIVNERFPKEEGEKFCSKLMGQNATLLHLDNEEEYNEVSSELLLRFSSYSSSFWLDGDPHGNDSYTNFDTSRHYYPSSDSNIGRRCLMMSPRSVWVSGYPSGHYTYTYRMNPASCCEERMIICEKALDKGSRLGWNFEFNDSVYKVMTNKPTTAGVAQGVCRTLGLFFGSGHLVEIDSEDELLALSAELKVRHLGSQFEYWVRGNPNGNLTYNKLLRDPTSEENCTILTHEGFPDIPWTKHSLDLMPAKCDTKKKFICELNLYQGGPIFQPSKQEASAAPPPEDDDDVPKELVTRSGCVGPCIGLAVAFPFAIILAVAITAAVFIYCKRRDHFGFSFHKASDEVYLTA